MGQISDWIRSNIFGSNDDDWWPDSWQESEFGQSVATGLDNWWKKTTGQAHLTSEYMHEEELANTAYQRAAKDMEAAGLSKFGGVNPASSPSPKSGNGLLSTMMAATQLKGAMLDNKKTSYDFKKAKEWGVPTSAVGDFAKYDALSKFLFGKPLHDIVGEDGLIGLIRGLFPSSDQGGDLVDSVTGSVATDAVQSILKSDVDDGSGFLEPVNYLGENKSLENVLVPKTAFIASPEAIEGLKVSLGDKLHYSPINVMRSVNPNYQSDMVHDVDMAAKQMLNDDMLIDDNINRFSEIIAKHYGYDMIDVRKLFDDWLSENKGEVIYRW